MTIAAEMVRNIQSGIAGEPEYRGILAGMKSTDLPFEALGEFSNAPFEFQNKALLLWKDTQLIYIHACTANRFSGNYLMLCTQLEKNIRQLGSFCLTKAVLEQQGQSFPELSELSIKELVSMVSFHIRKAHAALEGIYRDNDILGMTYLNWEYRWIGLDNRLRATEVKIEKIKNGEIHLEPVVLQAETFKDEPRTNQDSRKNEETAKSLRANANALPFNGAMAGLMGYWEKKSEKDAEQKRKERERKLRRAERLERESGMLPKPFEPDREMTKLNKQMEAEAIRAELKAEEKEKEEEEIKTQTEQEEPKQQNPGTVSEAEARKILMEDAMKRKDQKAIMAIPLEDTATLHDRWVKFTSRVGPRAGPADDVRKALREKRKKKKK